MWPKLFVSYRWQDTLAESRWFHEAFETEMGRGSTYLDVHSNQVGQDFEMRMAEELDQSDAHVVLIGSAFVVDREAYILREIEAGLERCRPFIPVLIGDALMPTAKQLPVSIQDFAKRHAIRVPGGSKTLATPPVLDKLHEELLGPKPAFVVSDIQQHPEWQQFSNSFSSGRFAKARVAKVVGEKLADMPQGTRIFFGPGTTTFDVFMHLAQNAFPLDNYRIYTCNGGITAMAPRLGLNIKRIGDAHLSNYPTHYYERLPADIPDLDVSIIGLAGIGWPSDHFDCRTCRYEQVQTIAAVTGATRHQVIFVGHGQKLINHGEGCPFFSFSEMRRNCQQHSGKRFDLLFDSANPNATKIEEYALNLDQILGCRTCESYNVYSWSFTSGGD